MIILVRSEKFDLPVLACHALVCDCLSERNIALRSPEASPEEILRLAVVDAERHGFSMRHLLSLDCFHYAQAKIADAVMLTNDRQLRATDLRVAP